MRTQGEGTEDGEPYTTDTTAIRSRTHTSITRTRDINNSYNILFGMSEPPGNGMGEYTRRTGS
jgi:hypothetical protein